MNPATSMTAKADSLPRPGRYVATDMTDDDLLAVLNEAADAAVAAVAASGDFTMVDATRGQHAADVAADEAAVAILLAAGLGVLSEESGRHHADRPITAVLDPLDGSTNAAHGLPWTATSICAVD